MMGNKGADFQPIYNTEFDTRGEAVTKILTYSFKKLYRLSDLFAREGRASDENRTEALSFLNKDFGKFVGNLMAWTSMPYTRTSKEQRAAYAIQQMEAEFGAYMRGKVNITDAEIEKRSAILRDKIGKILKDLEK